MVRVRELLSMLNSVEVAELKKLLPRGVAASPPEEPPGTRYPAALLSALPAGDQYSLAGHITEALLRHPPVEITPELLISTARTWCPVFGDLQAAKVTASKTTEPYLEHIRQTRIKLRTSARGAFQYDTVVGDPATVEGHPDIRTETQIYEVKMTGQLRKNWLAFLFQVFCYAALEPTATDVYLVLPLQEIVWHYPLQDWANRAAFRAYLQTAATKKDSAGDTAILAALLIEAHLIGSHKAKLKSLVDTVHSLPYRKPSQIFLAGPQSSRLQIADAELAGARAVLEASHRRLFIHSPYIINLCTPADTDNDGYHTRLLIKNLQYGVAMGARGVVVHVGKSTKQEPVAAMATMRANTVAALEHATPDCPLLLETPAGQGTEVLRTWDEFAAFVSEINDPRLRICVDTCHVFACGHEPRDYIRRLITTHPGLTRLIHFNDSATPCGSCLDRHAFVGQGHIGIHAMSEIAELATEHALPMVIE
jgi:deoxyribonuclease-4